MNLRWDATAEDPSKLPRSCPNAQRRQFTYITYAVNTFNEKKPELHSGSSTSTMQT